MRVQTVGVLGAGLMGAGIAQVSVESGYKVLLKDEVLAGLVRGENQIKAGMDPKVQACTADGKHTRMHTGTLTLALTLTHNHNHTAHAHTPAHSHTHTHKCVYPRSPAQALARRRGVPHAMAAVCLCW